MHGVCVLYSRLGMTAVNSVKKELDLRSSREILMASCWSENKHQTVLTLAK